MKLNKSKITLVGLSGTGKSTLGPMLASRWRFEFLDTDAEIEARTRKRISEIFARYGEPKFREIEAQVIVDAMEYEPPMVVSTGGGAILREDSRRLMKERSVVVWLTASVETLARRITSDPKTKTLRPKCADVDKVLANIAKLASAREAYYRDVASLIVDTENRTLDELVMEIADEAPNFFI